MTPQRGERMRSPEAGRIVPDQISFSEYLNVEKSEWVNREILSRHGPHIDYGQSPHQYRASVQDHASVIDYSGSCHYPVRSPISPAYTMLLRCRRCGACRYSRAEKLAYRAVTEIDQSPRTWFTSFTVYPPHFYYYCEVRDISPTAQLNSMVTLYLKRLRKSIQPRKIRYFYVMERQKNGTPHAHLLIHEVDRPVTYREIVGKWPSDTLGFNYAKLAQREHAWYITKYLLKDQPEPQRQRLSFKYGSPISVEDIAARSRIRGLSPQDPFQTPIFTGRELAQRIEPTRQASRAVGTFWDDYPED